MDAMTLGWYYLKPVYPKIDMKVKIHILGMVNLLLPQAMNGGVGEWDSPACQ